MPVFIEFCRFLSDFWDKLTSKLLKNTQGCFTMREEVAESYMLNGNGVQKELFLTQPNFLIMPKINLNLLRKLASLVTWVNSRWFLALKKNLASLKKSSFFYAASIQQILNKWWIQPKGSKNLVLAPNLIIFALVVRYI